MVVDLGNRHILLKDQRFDLALLLVDSTPPYKFDRRTAGFIRSQVYRLRQGYNLMARDAYRAILTVHDWHKDPEISDLATGALEDIDPGRRTWYL